MVNLSIYIDDGNVFEYSVTSEAKAREHMAAIVKAGYRSVSSDQPDLITWWPAHRILKVVAKLEGASSTKYPDKIVST
jgi:hypothetical protein